MYDFKTLSPLDFEDLVRDLLQADMGIRLESFGPGPDQGIDCRHAKGSNQLIVQAKHLASSSSAAIVTAAKKELPKIQRLSPSRYILAASLPLTPHLKTRILAELPGVPLAEGDILGKSELNSLLGKHPAIEQQHFKLWLASAAVLDRILHSGVYNRTAAEMEVIRTMIPRFVANPSISEAESILTKVGALVIAGEPGVGKTTLARLLLWLHAEQGWKIFVVDDIQEAYEVADANERRLILFDDFLGQVRLSLDLVRSMDQGLPRLLSRVRGNKNLRFILTTRDYILRQAQSHAQRLDAAHIASNELVLRVGAYTRGIRARMLYNHIYHSGLAPEQYSELLSDDFYLKIIDHKNFNPRLIDLLTSPEYVALSDAPLRATILAVLSSPQTLWDKPFRSHISGEARALLFALYFNRPEVFIVALQRSFSRSLEAMELSVAEAERYASFRSALKETEGSFIAIENRKVRFANPGVRDFIGQVVIEDRFLPHALKTLTEYDEVDQAWTFFSSQGPRAQQGHPLTATWELAAERMIEDCGGSAHERYRLVLDMYNDLKSERLLGLVRRTLTDIEGSEPDDCDASECTAVLEATEMSLLPIDDLDYAKGVCARDVAARLAHNGIQLTLDEIRSVTDALTGFSDDPSIATDAAHDALTGFIDGIDDGINEISSLSELEEFSTELRTLMSDYSVCRWAVERELQERREQLERLELRDDYERYKGSHSMPRTVDATDGEIRSMFSQLWNG